MPSRSPGPVEISIDRSQKGVAEFYRCEISSRILKARPENPGSDPNGKNAITIHGTCDVISLVAKRKVEHEGQGSDPSQDVPAAKANSSVCCRRILTATAWLTSQGAGGKNTGGWLPPPLSSVLSRGSGWTLQAVRGPKAHGLGLGFAPRPDGLQPQTWRQLRASGASASTRVALNRRSSRRPRRVALSHFGAPRCNGRAERTPPCRAAALGGLRSWPQPSGCSTARVGPSPGAIASSSGTQ